MMPNNAAQPTAGADPVVAAAATGKVTLDTRFGVIEFDRADAIRMPRGLLGYTEFREYGLSDLPNPGVSQFKLLQSLVEPTLSFVVAPFNIECGAIEEDDLDGACRSLSITAENLAIVLIVATRKIGPETQVSVNLRAPIFIDTLSQTGWQFVLPKDRYPIRHVIMSEAAKAGQQG